jgi:hypothetical protein
MSCQWKFIRVKSKTHHKERRDEGSQRQSTSREERPRQNPTQRRKGAKFTKGSGLKNKSKTTSKAEPERSKARPTTKNEVAQRILAAARFGLGLVNSRAGLDRLLEKIFQHEHRVGGTFGEPSHEIRVPLSAKGYVDAHSITFFYKLLLQVTANPVEHLELESG